MFCKNKLMNYRIPVVATGLMLVCLVQYHGAIFKGPDPGHCDLLFLIFLSIKKIKKCCMS